METAATAAAHGLLSLSFSLPAVAMTTAVEAASLAETMVAVSAVTTAASGSSYFFSSVDAATAILAVAVAANLL
ncbi:MAG: hypothetical protein K2H34_07030 [Lachnospiraceae bacterium]|nr:hypothetical protein [Lachnospiraceae bacterium]